MILFILKGLIRDRYRSFFPILMVSLSVAIVVFGQAYINGAMGGIVEVNARFEAGHNKLTTQGYYEQDSLNPNELALTGLSGLLSDLSANYPHFTWHPRIKFGGLLDFPDEEGETLEQGAVVGVSAVILGQSALEREHLNLPSSIIKGRLPNQKGEILISDSFFEKLKIKLGQKATLISTSMVGSPAVANFTVVGTVRFGVAAMDRGAMIADISDIQYALYMEDAASEILGFNHKGYHEADSENIKLDFNSKTQQKKDQIFSPIMSTIKDQESLGQYIELGKYMGSIIASLFVFIVTIVLWNSGLRNGLRRYSEFGLRLAIGEGAYHIYLSQIWEAFFIGIAGSIVGTFLGLIPAYYLQEVGLDIRGMMQPAASASAMLFQDIINAEITLTTYWIGFIPGVLATTLGAMMAGVGIFRRSTAQLFKELEL